MTQGLWKKLNLKEQRAILVIGSPESFEGALDLLTDVETVRDLESAAEVEFLVAFVTRSEEIIALSRALAIKGLGDPVVWFAYPKKSSKKYSCEFSRDTGWEPLGEAGFEAVRQVAIDDDWSALRFRRVEHIRSMRRDRERAMTAEGRSKTTQGNSAQARSTQAKSSKRKAPPT
ncbi:MAG: hypothetical protein K8J08_22780 [Thermoanaerobaculia bacterium]|nr:hypothetical protein [Thermoanaerobaculia bacterium]